MGLTLVREPKRGGTPAARSERLLIQPSLTPAAWPRRSTHRGPRSASGRLLARVQHQPGAPHAFVGTVTFQSPGSTATWQTTGVRWELAQSRGYPETGHTYDYVAVSGTISSHDVGDVGGCTVTVDATGSIPADLNGAPLLRIDTTHSGAPTYSGYSEMYVHITYVTTPGTAPENDCTGRSTNTSPLAWFSTIEAPQQVATGGGSCVLAGSRGAMRGS